MSEIEIRPARVAEAAAISALVLAAFEAFVASHYGPEGRATFEREVAPEAMAARLADGRTALVACTAPEGALIGYIETEKSHIRELFVAGHYQHRGIGRDLLARAFRARAGAEITVNAAPGSERAYRRFGFAPAGPWKTENGLTYLPMVRRPRATDSLR